MYTQVKKSKENKSQSLPNRSSQRQGSREGTFQFVDNRPENITQENLHDLPHKSAGMEQLSSIQEISNSMPNSYALANLFKTGEQTSLADSSQVTQQRGFGTVQRSIRSRYNWRAYFGGLLNNQVACNAIFTAEAHTTLQERHNANGDLTHRIIRLHTWANRTWGEIGSVTIDRSVRHAIQGPLPPGALALPGAGYDDRELTLHTAAVGGGGNVGVATHLFPAVLAWIDANLRGVQQVNMNPAGGAASKSVIADLGGRLGTARDHANAARARAGRRATGSSSKSGCRRRRASCSTNWQWGRPFGSEYLGHTFE